MFSLFSQFVIYWGSYLLMHFLQFFNFLRYFSNLLCTFCNFYNFMIFSNFSIMQIVLAFSTNLFSHDSQFLQHLQQSHSTKIVRTNIIAGNVTCLVLFNFDVWMFKQKRRHEEGPLNDVFIIGSVWGTPRRLGCSSSLINFDWSEPPELLKRPASAGTGEGEESSRERPSRFHQESQLWTSADWDVFSSPCFDHLRQSGGKWQAEASCTGRRADGPNMITLKTDEAAEDTVQEKLSSVFVQLRGAPFHRRCGPERFQEDRNADGLQACEHAWAAVQKQPGARRRRESQMLRPEASSASSDLRFSL